jgi:NAD(P)-dependent dehydrogenase (short-subunit alcohol dehydrogenase family)
VDIEHRVAVVTGGASGIGRSISLALAAAGAAGVVVADIDAAGAAAVAGQIEAAGGRALAVRTDVSREADVQALVAQAEDVFGPVDLFFSNAGIIVGGGVEVADDAWSRTWAVNVQSHIYVARALLPGMLARGQGYLVITASAAGLLTQLGSAPYAVTKHAAVALAEWLSITYGEQGLIVSALCPQAVTSNLLATSRRELGQDAVPAGDGPASEDPAGEDPAGEDPAGRAETRGSAQAAVDGVLGPDEVAQTVLAAVRAGQFLILPHPDVATYERRRADDRERWLRGMRRLQARLGGG